MKAYRRIVVATDFSNGSKATIGAVEAVASHDETIVHVVHVLEPLVYALPAPVELEHERRRRADADAELARFCATLTQRVPAVHRVRSHVLAGNPANEICRLATELRAHLIIVGSHGRTGLTRALIGSVAERVARHAHRPVLIVPAGR